MRCTLGNFSVFATMAIATAAAQQIYICLFAVLILSSFGAISKRSKGAQREKLHKTFLLIKTYFTYTYNKHKNHKKKFVFENKTYKYKNIFALLH